MKWDAKFVEVAIDILRRSSSPDAALKSMAKTFKEDITWNALRKALLKYKQISPKDVLNYENRTDELDAIVAYLNTKSKKHTKSLEGLCNYFNRSPQYIKGLIDQAQTLGYKFDLIDDKILLNKKATLEVQSVNVDMKFSIEKTVKFAVISDTHFGSEAARPDFISHFVERAYAEGIRKIIHGGDILTGNSVYRGQVAELSHWGCHKQCLEACKGLPQKKDLEYYAILGNHDMDFVKSAGIDPGLILEPMRPDIHVIGQIKGRLVLQPANLVVEVIHVKSSATSKSYPLEKHISKSISQGFLPDVVLAGHRHTSGYFPMNGIQCFMLPCFEDENIFVKYHDFVPEVGGVIITLHLNADNKIVECIPQFIYYSSKKESATPITI